MSIAGSKVGRRLNHVAVVMQSVGTVAVSAGMEGEADAEA